ncbi:MAG: hypothetical protein GXO79_05530 [Chlorobi bacterium]|nr:hypothetical protein [Chlorobiota bacterium]
MIYKLDKISMGKMLEMPESGIGYQLIKARKNDEKQIKNFVVFNAEILIDHDEKLKIYSNTLIGNGYEILTKVLSIVELKDIQILYEGQIINQPITSNLFNNSVRTGYSETADIYIRPGIYINDNRIDMYNKMLLPGSFVTTVESYTNCHIMRNDPVELFTLPVQQDYIKVIYVKQNKTNIHINGSFNNDFNRAGGGDKICFKTSSELLLKKGEKTHVPNLQGNM